MRRTGTNMAQTYGGSRAIDLVVIVMSAVFFTHLLADKAPQAEERVYAYPVVVACTNCD